MNKAEELLERDIDKSIGFFEYVFNFDDENKACILNMFQYILTSIIPIVFILKVVKEYIPEEDDSKNNVELALEIIIQLGILFMGVWFINKIIRFFPTYSNVPYHKFNETNFIIPILIILITMQTKLGSKINILADRLEDAWNGNISNSGQRPQPSNVRVRQPLGQAHQPSRADTRDSGMIPPPAQNMNPGIDRSSTLINNLPNLNNGQNSGNENYGNDAANLALLESDNEPMAANGLLGGAFGSGW